MALGGLLNDVSNYMNATSSNPARAQFGQNQILRGQEQDDASVALTNTAKKSILEAHLAAATDPNTPAEQLPAIKDNIAKLASSMGIDPNTFGDIDALRQPAKPELKAVGGSIVSIDPATQSVTPVYTAPDKNRDRPVSISPGSQLVGPDGKVLHENKNARFAPPRPAKQTTLGFKQKRMQDAESAMESARVTAEEGGLSDQINYAMRKIEHKQANDFIGVQEGKELRKGISESAAALKSYDQQYAKAIAILEKNPDAATVGGDVAKALTSAKANALGLAGTLAGFKDLSTSMEDWGYELTEVAGNNNELKSIIFSLAIQNAVAKGLDKNGISNRELEESIKDIGGRTRSPQSIKRRLKEVRTQLASALRNRIDTAIDNYEGVSMEDPVQKTGLPAGVSQEIWDNMTPEEKALWN